MDGNSIECLQAREGTYGYIKGFRRAYSDNIKFNSFNLCLYCVQNTGALNVEDKIRKNKHPALGAKHNIYYGYKEAKRLGLTYTYPDPEIYNNTEDYK